MSQVFYHCATEHNQIVSFKKRFFLVKRSSLLLQKGFCRTGLIKEGIIQIVTFDIETPNLTTELKIRILFFSTQLEKKATKF
jgi:hypothetical protein